LPAILAVIRRIAESAKALSFRTLTRLHLEDTMVERLPQHLQHMVFELRQIVEEQDTIGQR
jgi:hypothetical protein